MVHVVFTPNLQRHVDCPPCTVAGVTVRAALDAAFAMNERARGYVLDEHGALRKHMSWQCRAEGMRAAYMPPDRAMDPVIQDPHRVVQCQARPDFFWAQHHNGVFRSVDGSRRWTELTQVPPSVFGFAVAVHPHDPDTLPPVYAVRFVTASRN